MYVEDIAAMLLFKIFTPHKKRENPYTYSYDISIQHLHNSRIYGEKVYTQANIQPTKHFNHFSYICTYAYIWIKSTRCYNTRWWSPVFCLIRCSCVAHYTQALFSRKKHLNSSLFILLQQNTQNLVCCCCVQYKWEECIIMWRVYKRLQSTDFVYSVYGVAV